MVRNIQSQFLASLLVLLSCTMAACAAAGGGDMKQASVQLQGEGPFQRFIVHFRDGTEAAKDAGRVQARLEATVAKAGLEPGVVPTWQRRLAVHADVFTIDRPLGRADAEAMMQAFASDPEVQYIEVDGMMGIGPIIAPPRPLRQGD